MATIVVDPVSGSDTNPGTAASPFKTIPRGLKALTPGDKLVGRAGLYSKQATEGSNALVIKTENVHVYGEPGAIIDQGGTSTGAVPFGFRLEGDGKKNVKIEGWEIRNTGVGISTGRYWFNIEILKNHVHHTRANGIEADSGGDLIYIHHNHVHHCDLEETARSGISVLAPQTKAGASGLLDLVEAGEWGVIIVDNNVHDIGYLDGSNADGNNVIIDKPNFFNIRYTRRILITRNFLWNSAGCGVKAMAAERVTIKRNTLWHNKQNLFIKQGKTRAQKRDSWVGEIDLQLSWNCIVEENIAIGNTYPGAVLAHCGHQAENDKNTGIVDLSGFRPDLGVDQRLSGNQWRRNLVYAEGEEPRVAAPLGKASSLSVPESGYTVGLPTFNNPAAGDFSLKAGSLGLTMAADGGPVGAWRGGTTPVVVLTKTADAVMTILGDPIDNSDPDRPVYPVGATVRFSAPTYNVTPDTVTHTLEWWNGAKYEAKAATITGPSSGLYSTTAPSVTKKGGIRVKTVATKSGSPDVTSTSNWIDIAPAPVVTETAPENTVLPVIAPNAPKVGSAATCPTGTWKGATPMAFARQWQVGGVDVPGATGASYTPVSGDKTKPLTCKVTATNSKGSAFVISAATSAVTDPVNLTLEELTAQILAAQAELAAQRADINAVTARTDAQDAAIEGIQADFGARLGNLETDTGGVRERVDVLDNRVGEVDTLLSATAETADDAAARVSALEGLVPGSVGTRKLRIYHKDE